MRILCLHGHRTSGAILREQMLEVPVCSRTVAIVLKSLSLEHVRT